MRKYINQVGINFLLWRSELDDCQKAINQLLSAGFNDIVFLTIQTAGFGVHFAHERMEEDEIASFMKNLDMEYFRLTACHKPPYPFASADMGCGANDWFVSITEDKIVKSCSFVNSGNPLATPTYEALISATKDLPRLPCYRSFKESKMAKLAGIQ